MCAPKLRGENGEKQIINFGISFQLKESQASKTDETKILFLNP